MKKMIAVLLCMVMLFSALSVLCFAGVSAEGNNEPGIESFLENTIGKLIPTGPDLSNGFFRVLNAIRDALSRMIDFNKEMLNRITQAVSSIGWVPSWMR